MARCESPREGKEKKEVRDEGIRASLVKKCGCRVWVWVSGVGVGDMWGCECSNRLSVTVRQLLRR